MPPIPTPLVPPITSILAVKGKYAAQVANGGKLFPNVQNFGLPKGQCAVRHKNGKFHQFAIRAEQDIPPLLTHLRVADAVGALIAGNLTESARLLTVESEFLQHGEGVLRAVLTLWLTQNGIDIPPAYFGDTALLAPELQSRLLLTRTDRMPFALSIAAVGSADDSGTSVVPEDWLGRRFENGEELCRAIDTLPHRQGEAETTYCCHFGLKLVPAPKWLTASEVEAGFQAEYGIAVLVENGAVKTSIQKLTPDTLTSWIQSQPEQARFLHHEFKPPGNEDAGFGRCMLIACDTAGVCEPVPVYQKRRSVGLLSSMMQKCIRRGRQASQTLAASLDELHKAPTYHLPDDHFKRSSGCRQMAWRLFISIFEDAEPYTASPNGDYLSMEDLVALSILAHAEPDLQFNQFIAHKILRTALLVQRNDAAGKNWNWRIGGKKTAITGSSPLETLCTAALDFMPMMERDAAMLHQGCEHIRISHLKFSPLPNQWSNDEMLGASDPEVEKAAVLASDDFHCTPAILLYLQASLPQISSCSVSLTPVKKKRNKTPRTSTLPAVANEELPPTTHNLKRFIWENVSRLNTRNPHYIPASAPSSEAIIREIHSLQRWLLNGELPELPLSEPYAKRVFAAKSQSPVDPIVARVSFLSIFGQKIVLPAATPKTGRRLDHSFVAVVAGTPHEPIKIKKKGSKHSTYLTGEERTEGELDVVDHLAITDGMDVELPPPPAGYRWKFTDDRKTIRIRIALWHAEPPGEGEQDDIGNKLVFHADEVEVPAFDASCLLERREETIPVRPSPSDERLIQCALYLETPKAEGQWGTNQALRLFAKSRLDSEQPDLQWPDLAAKSPVPAVVWQRAYTKLLSTFLGRVIIGPVDRHGDKTFAAVDYLYEGTLWRIFNLLAFVYPDCVRPCKGLDFEIHKESSSYPHLLQALETLAAPQAQALQIVETPTVTTPLWQHQASSAVRITEGLLKNGKKGFGDASDVGAGKTLTSLAIMCNLAQHNRDTGDETAEAFLVLVYNETLIETWKTEIGKHTSGFHFVSQDASRQLSEPLSRHSILVTTLGRMRDTPITRRWHLVVIDECLSVQNANALWTQEAWKQVACSQRGVLLLSATFFRARFNELFYLLRMLRTGLPETQEYLDAILSESIVCHLPENTPWHWTEELRLLPLDPETRQVYDSIRKSGGPEKMVYGKLDSLLVERFNFAAHLFSLLDELEEGCRALIFARSAPEAAKLASLRPDVTLFPDITGRHVVTTTAKAARGVNTLVDFNVLISRPVEPDLVPQMRGRLARPGQQHHQLRWIWMVIERTIEQAKLERNQMAEKFHDEHIMPLASFYRRALSI